MLTISSWMKSFENLAPVGVLNAKRVEGLCKKGTGGRFLFAKVTLEFSPSNSLTLQSHLSDEQKNIGEEEGWVQAIFLGVLDVMLVTPATPITQFRCVIENIEFHQIDSSRQAFRLAARDAAKQYLDTEKFVIQ